MPTLRITPSDGIRSILLADARLIGGVSEMNYSTATVITDDFRKRDAGGIPRHCFLLATTLSPHRTHLGDLEDEEVILLRVVDAGRLSRHGDLNETREEAMRVMIDRDPEIQSDSPIDALTQTKIQESALLCQILGTFYDDQVGDSTYVEYGADLDTLYASARYWCYKPSPQALAFIASYPEITRGDLENNSQPDRIRIGTVRYSSTRRRAQAAAEHQVPVSVRIEDFISQKVAVLGMTRAGKSNTMKTLATAIFTHSRRTDVPIGQLFFDPSGEYASINVQDKTAMREIGGNWVAIYRFGATTADAHRNINPLQLNFYDEDQRQVTKDLMATHLSQVSMAAYLDRFINAELEDPPDSERSDPDYHSRCCRASRARLGFYATLVRADFRVPQGWKGIRVSMKNDLADQILCDHPGAFTKLSGGYIQVSNPDGLLTVMDWICVSEDTEALEWAKGEGFQAMVAVYDRGPNNRAGFTWFRKLADFHNPAADRLFTERIYDDLRAGRIVIIDISLGSELVTKALSETVVVQLLAKAKARFRANMEPVRMQLFLEEAHQLFDRGKFSERNADPWVTLAKEAAKYKIGFCYATQEVTSVDHLVLANTYNWAIAHLNNTKEVQALAAYEGFGAFAEQILNADDRGFIRLKTMSGKFVVPVQVDLFAPQRIAEARVAAGLSAITPAESGIPDIPTSTDAPPEIIPGEGPRLPAPPLSPVPSPLAPIVAFPIQGKVTKSATKTSFVSHPIDDEF